MKKGTPSAAEKSPLVILRGLLQKKDTASHCFMIKMK